MLNNYVTFVSVNTLIKTVTFKLVLDVAKTDIFRNNASIRTKGVKDVVKMVTKKRIVG